MITTDPRFALFFVLVFAMHWALRTQQARRNWLLLCSYAFYACWDWRFLSLLWVSTLVDWLAALRIGATRSGPRRRAWLALSLITNLGLLGFFKYYGFFVESATSGLAALGFDVSVSRLEIVLPVGISFYTFQTLSYTLDVHAGRLRPRRSLTDVALFVAFFPQLVAGPIVKARDFLPQLDTRRQLSAIAARTSLMLFAIGYFKKACVADALAPIVDNVYAHPAAYDLPSLWTALGLYAAQFYCDFSGYSDMAIGLAGLLGYGLRENFRFPFLATSLVEFWRRWHISLGAWVNEYVWRPLRGTMPTPTRAAATTFFVMVLIGLWHGAAWTFVVLGVTHGLVLAWSQHRHVRRQRLGHGMAARQPLLVSLPAWLATQLFVCCTMVLFRASDLSAAGTLLSGVAGFTQGTRQLGPAPVLALAALALLHGAGALRIPQRVISAVPSWTCAVAFGLAAALLPAFASGAAEAFIYFQF